MDYSNIILNLLIVIFFITLTRNLVYIFLGPIYSFSKARVNKSTANISLAQIEEKIRVSVVIPAWNEEVGVLNSIRSLLESSYSNLEVILVDDGSTDSTRLLVNKFIEEELGKYEKEGKSFKAFFKKNGGKGSALNHGIKRSTGDLIITMDADTLFEKESIANAARYFLNEKLDAAVGNVKVGNPNSFLGIIQQIEYIIGFYFKRTHSLFNSEYIIGGAFGVFRKNVFEKYGLFDEKNITEDIEFSTRLQKNGCRIAFIEDAVAYTETPATLKSLMKQRLRWKKGRLDAFYVHRELFFSRDKKHSKFLTHYLLPITLFYELELLIEPFVILFGVYYLYTTENFYGLFAWIIFTGIMHTMPFIFGVNRHTKRALIIIPIYFILSYVILYVEIYAMYASIRSIITKKDISWQKWDRKGLIPG